MYDDLVDMIAYQVILDDAFIKSVFEYSTHFGAAFFGVLGIVIGVRFLKSAFDL